MKQAPSPYTFQITNEAGVTTNCRYPTYSEAYRRARVNGRPPIYFIGSDGIKHLVEHVDGQEQWAE